jgi:hypothetical protein
MLKFEGSLEELQDSVMRCAIRGKWSFHKKSRFYRFQTATGAILNWWPSTATINFQGHDAELFEALFLKHALVGATQSEGVRVYEESAWEAVPDPTPCLGGSRASPGSTGTEDRRDGSQPTSRLIPRTVKLLTAPDRG